MRRLLGLVLLLVGAFAFCMPWFPVTVTDPLPSWFQNRGNLHLTTWGGAFAMLAALLLLFRPRRTRRAIDDEPIRKLLLKRGFEFTEFPDGWLARGIWDDEAVSLRWDSGYHAGRFGRPHVIVLTCPGAPIDPLPLRHDQVVLVETRADAFDVVLLEAAMAGRQDTLPQRVDQVLAARR